MNKKIEILEKAAELVKLGAEIADDIGDIVDSIPETYTGAESGDLAGLRDSIARELATYIVNYLDHEGMIDGETLDASIGSAIEDAISAFAGGARDEIPAKEAAKNMKLVNLEDVLAPGVHFAMQTPAGPDQDNLKMIFNIFCAEDDWKAPIDATIKADEFDAIGVRKVKRAIEYFTATTPNFTRTRRGKVELVRVTAEGYREGPAGP